MFKDELSKLEELHNMGFIDNSEYESRKKQIQLQGFFFHIKNYIHLFFSK